MTEEERLLLVDLKANTNRLFHEYLKLETNKKMLEDKIAALMETIQQLEQRNNELSQKNEQLKVATRILSGVDENREAKQKINKLVREIDKCIALLNK
jgi:hypothetical protein